jgi:plasmid rolling circle replication initiator protein Rep
VLRYSKKEPRRERQLRHCEFLFKCGQFALANRLIRCADSAAIAQRLSLAYPDYQCDSRYCEYCGPRKAAHFRRAYGPVLEGLIYEGYRSSHLVLTIKNVNKLERGHSDRLLQAFNKMYRSNPLKMGAVGAFVQYEVNFNGDWNPHLHVILVYKKCSSWDEISKAWYRFTGSYQVYIRKIRYDDNDPDIIHYSVSRIMNYICKYTSVDEGVFESIFESTFNKKLIRTYGLMRNRSNGAC